MSEPAQQSNGKPAVRPSSAPPKKNLPPRPVVANVFNSLALETEVIGALLLAGDASQNGNICGRSVGLTFAYLEKSDFWDERIAKLYGILRDLWRRNEVWYPLGALWEQLRCAEAAVTGAHPKIDAAWLAEVIQSAGFPPSLPGYAKLLRKARIRRELSFLAHLAWTFSEAGDVSHAIKEVGAGFDECRRLVSTIEIDRE